MKKSGSVIALDDVFASSQSEIVSRYIDELRDAFKRSDTVVLVARKALCFFYALEANGLLEWPQDCRLLSSRAIDYADIGGDLGHIIVVDDVMVSGRSLRNACTALRKHNLGSELLVAAISPDVASNSDFRMNVRAVSGIGQIQAYEFALAITKYIRLSGVSNNVDQPVIKVVFADESAKRRFFAQHEWTNLETPDQLERGIESKTLAFEHRIMGNSIGIGVSEFGFMPKARAISRKGFNEVVLIPFVLIDELSYEAIDAAFENVMTEEANFLVDDFDVNCAKRNKLRILQYVLARRFGNNFVRGLKGVTNYEVDARHELLLFGRGLRQFVRTDSPVLKSVADSGSELTSVTSSVIRTCASDAYIRLLVQGCCIAEKYTTPWFDAASPYLDTFDGLRCSLFKGFTWRGTEQCADVLASGATDMLIDEGVYVPCAAIMENDSNPRMVRAYRGGEVFELDRINLRRFALMLTLYCEQDQSKSLLQEVAMRLAPLFFRWSDIGAPQVYERFDLWKSNRYNLVDGSEYEDASRSRLLAAMQSRGLVSLANGKVKSELSPDSEECSTANDGAEGMFADAFRKVGGAFDVQDGFVRLLDLMIMGYSPSYAAAYLYNSVSALSDQLPRRQGEGIPSTLSKACDSLERCANRVSESADFEPELKAVAKKASVHPHLLQVLAFGDKEAAELKAFQIRWFVPLVKHAKALIDEARSLSDDSMSVERLYCVDHSESVLNELNQHCTLPKWDDEEYSLVAFWKTDDTWHFKSQNSQGYRGVCLKAALSACGGSPVVCFPDESMKIYSTVFSPDGDSLEDYLPVRIAKYFMSIEPALGDGGSILVMCSAEEVEVSPGFTEALLFASACDREIESDVTNRINAKVKSLQGYHIRAYTLREAPSRELKALREIASNTQGLKKTLPELESQLKSCSVSLKDAAEILAEANALDESDDHIEEKKRGVLDKVCKLTGLASDSFNVAQMAVGAVQMIAMIIVRSVSQ